MSSKDLEVAMHIQANHSYQASPSSRVSSPNLEKLDLNTYNNSQRSSRQFTKPSKRSRSNTPTSMNQNEKWEQEAREAGVSCRQRRKSNAGCSGEVLLMLWHNIALLTSVVNMNSKL